jgi:hypothetical protein
MAELADAHRAATVVDRTRAVTGDPSMQLPLAILLNCITIQRVVAK